MKIKINIQIFAAILFFIFTKQIEIYIWLMLFALIHEFAHMIAGIILKLKPKTLSLEPFGLSISFESYRNTDKNKIIIAFAGPLTNFIIAIIFLFIENPSQELIINSNLIIGLFNLIPIFPLDGGRILKSIIKIKKNSEYSDYILNKISNIILVFITAASSIFILLYKNIGILLIVGYLWMIVLKEDKEYKLKLKIKKIIELNDELL